MSTKTLSPQFIRKRKFFLVLPLLVLPFITMLFWALGGGKGNGAQAQEKMSKAGLNVELPEAYLKEEGTLNKLSYYEKAASDSAKLEELMKNDPYYLEYKRAQQGRLFPDHDTTLQLLKHKQQHSGEPGSLNTSPYKSNPYADPNEAKVYQKLDEINTAMNASTAKINQSATYPETYPGKRTVVSSADIDRLEQLMDQTKSGAGEEDPELKQLNTMMEKIMDIQHPERVKQQMSQASQAGKGHVFAVTTNSGNVRPSLLENEKEDVYNDSMQFNQLLGFFSLEDEPAGVREQQNTIQAVIHETQTLVDGSIVKLRLLEDVYVIDLLIPKGSFVFGNASLQGERLHIKIRAILFKNSLYPVQLSVIDMDGIEGIHVPGSITREVSGSSADRALQDIGATIPDPSFGAQAANAGIEAAKTLLRKKTKLVKVTLKGGYQVLLIDKKQKTSF